MDHCNLPNNVKYWITRASSALPLPAPAMDQPAKRCKTSDATAQVTASSPSPERAKHLPMWPSAVVSLEALLPEAAVQALKSTLEIEAEAKNRFMPQIRVLSAHAATAIHSLQEGDVPTATEAITTASKLAVEVMADIAKQDHAWWLRTHPSLTTGLQHLVTAKCLSHFFTQGCLLPRSGLEMFDDNEYLLGVIAFCQSLTRYAVGRATVADANSVVLCKDLAEEVFGELLQFDFRNGPLRRQYDGVKYVLRRLQDLIYELSLTGAHVAPNETAATDEKKLVNSDEFKTMRESMDAFDKRREDVIKSTRDVQKLSKQAIYSLHRGDTKATKQLDQAAAQAQSIFKRHLHDSPSLRAGSYSAAMEEFAEAMLFQVWLKEKRICAMTEDPFKGLVNETEYIGGLVDFTGEVGRLAVAAAGRRDEPTVRQALAAALSVQGALMHLEGKPGKKKGSELARNVEKLEQVLYELSLVKATGRSVARKPSESEH